MDYLAGNVQLVIAIFDNYYAKKYTFFYHFHLTFN